MRHWGIKNTVIGLLVVIGAAFTSTAGTTAATAAPAPTTSVMSAPLAGRFTVNAVLEGAVLTLTNVKRVAVGCRPLRLNLDLRQAARKHSYLMGRNRVMSHQLSGEPRLGRRVTLAGYTGWRKVAENIAAGFSTARLVVRAWWNSPSHRRNITDCSLREIGIGVVPYGGRIWWTQDFGRR
ncbi:CAP domain-containing protein [Nocardioides sp. WS12]|uniref:CAP domain-containing protein n=1 Tax=Nocardioides sp. WS12 TaxID=2486272 RepID=UPI0015FC526C|nr:CAP domain-containing protein [Nocardioides sp. WS12]